MLDAYAVRKAIPRIVLAVIGINLSIYLCVAMVDIVNVVSNGMARLLVTPFSTAGMTVFEVPTDAANGIVGGVGIAVGAGPMYAAVSAAVTAVATQGITVITGALGALFWMLIPILLLALAILVTVVIRQALIFFLIVISPVAIACYILPGTEKYFQKWWDLFVKALIVYPIIAVMFALSDVFAAIILGTNSGGLTGVAKIVTGIVVIYAPLFLIPFAFRFAGGAMSALANAAMGVGDRASKTGFVKSRREHYAQRNADNLLRGRAESYRRAAAKENTSSGLQRMYHGRRKRALTGYKHNILEREAELNKRIGEEVANTTNYGDDSVIRAYTANKGLADRLRSQGRGENDQWRYATDSQGNRTGAVEYRTAGGKWVDESSVDEAQKRYGSRNITQWQQSMAYEQKKALTQEEQDHVVQSFGDTMTEWGATEDQANGAWIGAGFANQQKNRQWKHGRWGRDASGQYRMSTGASNLIKEYDENIGTYEASQSNADTYTTMAQQVTESAASRDNSLQEIQRLQALPNLSANQQLELAEHQANVRNEEDTLHRASRIVSSLRTEQQARDENGQPIPGQMIEVIGAGAAGRTQEEMRAFAKITDHFAGKYTDQTDLGPGAPDRPAGNVEDSLNNRTGNRRV